MERVFKALADPSRRLLLDRLFEQDGQTLGELCRHLPGMTRFGVMRHLDVLEEAGLVTTRRDGREKRHFLNPVPIRLIHDRWISKFAEPVGDSCRLTLTHDQLREGASPEVYGGWPMILSGLKTWLETGELLTTPGSLMYNS